MLPPTTQKHSTAPANATTAVTADASTCPIQEIAGLFGQAGIGPKKAEKVKEELLRNVNIQNLAGLLGQMYIGPEEAEKVKEKVIEILQDVQIDCVIVEMSVSTG